jgi:type IV fimbrial biogenesis protein FimT
MRTGPANGFTLIEFMTAITVLSILLVVCVPSFSSIIRDNRITAEANDLVGALNFARSEAIKRGDPVSVCSSSDGSTCAGSTAWANGWIAFSDVDGTAGTVDAGDQVLQVWPAVGGGLTLTASRNFVQYISSGMTDPVANVPFDLLKPGCTGDYARRISVSTTGRISSATVSCP